MKSFLLFIVIFLGIFFKVHAQLNNSLLESSIVLSDSSQEGIDLSIDNNTFFKNNEYFHDITSGYTLFGSQLKTQIGYTINKHARIEAGLFARKDFGNNQFTQVAPLLSIKLQTKGISFIMGNLEGNVSHRLIEPIYDYERVILNNLEHGIQCKINHVKFWSDTWMNWEVQEYLNSDYQEQFSAGHSSITTLYSSQKGLELKAPIQFLFAHKGGQIDIDSTSLKTLFNAAIGLRLDYKNPNEKQFIRSLSSENYMVVFKDLSPTKVLNFKMGHGYYVNVRALSKYDIGASLGYWNGHDYLSSRGGDLFKSESSMYIAKKTIEPNRQLLFLRCFYQHRVFDAINVDVRFEPYFDLNKSYLEYTYSVYFTYKKDFRLLPLINGKRKAK